MVRVPPVRRRWLLGTTSASLALRWARLREALAAGSVEQGIYRLRGEAWVNAAPARPGRTIRPGDAVRTGAGSEIVYVIARDAMLVRADSRVGLEGPRGALVETGLRIVTGAVLSVFKPGEPKSIFAPTATIGIRGSGAYVEASPRRPYICTCYGIADIVPLAEPAERETVHSTHHSAPRFVLARGARQLIVPAPVFDHTDAELILLESLGGRKPPFVTPGYRPGAY